jgi:hypothetical protein
MRMIDFMGDRLLNGERGKAEPGGERTTGMIPVPL